MYFVFAGATAARIQEQAEQKGHARLRESYADPAKAMLHVGSYVFVRNDVWRVEGFYSGSFLIFLYPLSNVQFVWIVLYCFMLFWTILVCDFLHVHSFFWHPTQNISWFDFVSWYKVIRALSRSKASGWLCRLRTPIWVEFTSVASRFSCLQSQALQIFHVTWCSQQHTLHRHIYVWFFYIIFTGVFIWFLRSLDIHVSWWTFILSLGHW